MNSTHDTAPAAGSAMMSTTFVEQQRRHWDAVAGGWARWLEWTERNFASVTAWLARTVPWRPGVQMLDVACGAGYPALLAAAHVAPDGHVTATDLSSEMVAVTLRQAHERGLRNLHAMPMHTEHLDFPDGTFDVVSNLYGLMFSPDPIAALREARRVLKPGGRAAIVVWDEAAKSPFFSTITNVARDVLALTAPEPGAPGPFRFAPHGALEDALRGAGFSRVRVEAVLSTFECASADEYFQLFCDVAWKLRVDALAARQREEFKHAVAEAARPHSVHGSLRLPAASLCAIAEA